MKYDFDLEDHSKKRKEIFLRVLLCALEIGVYYLWHMQLPILAWKK